jgi:hypothetical protein
MGFKVRDCDLERIVSSYPVCGAADSIKPGVKRSGTAGNSALKIFGVRGAADSGIIIEVFVATSIDRFADSALGRIAIS